MKAIITILIVGGLLFGVWKLWEFYDQKTASKEVSASIQRARGDGSRLQGMDSGLESQYRDAMQGGLIPLRTFLGRYRNTPYLTDPRLAWIEIDYALLLRYKDPAEAKRVFESVRSRVKSGTPLVFERIKELENGFN